MNSMGDQPREVRIATDGVTASVTVGGVDLSRNLHGYHLEHQANQLPVLVLHAHATDAAVFDGMAHVAVADLQPAGIGAVEFLSGIDPDQLAQAALMRDDLDGSRNELTKAMLAQLIDWASGKAG